MAANDRRSFPLVQPIHPILLSGGSGARFWPVARDEYPKQMIPQPDGLSLLQQTVQRVRDFKVFDVPLVVCAEAHRFFVAEQLREVDSDLSQIILEPEAKGTALAIALGVRMTALVHPDAWVLVMPTDQEIRDNDGFVRDIISAQAETQADKIICFGVQAGSNNPLRGYILTDDRGYLVQFVEKPEPDQFDRLHSQSSHCWWNTGIYLGKAHNFGQLFADKYPELWATTIELISKRQPDLDFMRLDGGIVAGLGTLSFEQGVMAQFPDLFVMRPLNVGWQENDNWRDIYQAKPLDAKGNNFHGLVYAEDSKGCLVQAETSLVALIGVQNIAVIETKDAVLVLDLSRPELILELLNQLKAQNREEVTRPSRRYRPWGYFEPLVRGDKHQVNHVRIKPSATIGLRRHRHRHQHWVVVSGAAEITIDGEKHLLFENQSTYVPAGCPHQIHNVGRIPLEIIEIQTGENLLEDDVERLAVPSM